MRNKWIDNRRSFLRLMGIAGMGALTGLAGKALAGMGVQKLTILHTNDTHSRIDPYPMNDPRFAGMGGFARRAALINYFRGMDPDLLLLDAGDIFQGTPYYNFYGGEPELMLMSKMGYDAATIGNHEFDNGLDGLLKVMPHANFPFVTANLDFSDTLLKGTTKPYIILKRKGQKIGIYGLGIDPNGLVSPALFSGTRYLDPVEVARDMEATLLSRHRCNLIICLSHLGYSYRHNKVSDLVVAANTSHTDIIIGGHTHTVLDPPAVVANSLNQPVTIAQAGSGGVRMGVLNIYFEEGNNQKMVESYTTKISNKKVNMGFFFN